MNQAQAVLIILILFSCTGNFAHAQETRSLRGQINLDIATAVRDLTVDISVRNHSFVVLPPPFFGIVRPIQSQVTKTVVIEKGQSGISYSLSGIDKDPVDYTIKISCNGCDDIIRTQYYSPSGNRFGLENSVFIDPDDLPEQLDMESLTQGSILGAIALVTPASQDIRFKLTVLETIATNSIVKSDTFLMKKGRQAINYELSGLPRSSGSYLLQLQCLDCQGKAKHRLNFMTSLGSNMNHENIDFLLSSEGVAIMAPILELLID